MRIARSIFVGSVAVLAALASPALANGSNPNSHANANAQAVEEAPASSPVTPTRRPRRLLDRNGLP
jgi:hypothetical protein